MTDDDLEHVAPGMAPGGLWVALVVAGRLVDGVALLDEGEVDRTAGRHADLSVAARAEGVEALVAVYDGDSGDLLAVLEPGPAPPVMRP